MAIWQRDRRTASQPDADADRTITSFLPSQFPFVDKYAQEPRDTLVVCPSEIRRQEIITTGCHLKRSHMFYLCQNGTPCGIATKADIGRRRQCDASPSHSHVLPSQPWAWGSVVDPLGAPVGDRDRPTKRFRPSRSPNVASLR